ncbi:MarR family winged helix-turn-helix transcriptional regulator [Specibacter sp. NPDC057265]|uniref:MarR family winged helix-turn-helix transcriptional regulator n=1 Tax=Specibacter sp. NPDC057265 TaxID=3346075 RepID=UPI0036262029
MGHTGGGAPDLGELFHSAFRGLRRTWAAQLAPWELTPHQWRALMTLLRRQQDVQHPLGEVADAAAKRAGRVQGGQGHDGAPADGKPMRLKDLAERLRIAARSATEVVDQLEAKGLVGREADPSDRRATLIVPTAAGRELFANVSAERRDKSNEYFSQLSAQDRAELARILAQLRGH